MCTRCTNDPENFSLKFDHEGSTISPDPYAVLLIYKMKRKCTNEKSACTNDPDSLGSKFKNWGPIVSPAPFNAFNIQAPEEVH